MPAAAASLSNIAAPGADRQERVLGGGLGADPLVAGDLVVGVGEMRVVDGRGAGAGSTVPGGLDRPTVIKCADNDLVGPVVIANPYTLTQ